MKVDLDKYENGNLTAFFNLLISEVVHFDFTFTDVIKNNLCHNAALNVNLEVLKWARQNNYPWNEKDL